MGKIQQFLGIEKRRSLQTYGGVGESSYVLSQANAFFSQLLNNSSGQPVTPDTAEKLSAFYSCLRNISEDIAKVPFNVFKVDSNGNKVAVGHVSKTLLNKMPSSMSTPFTFRQALVKNALVHGNGYAYIDRDVQTMKPTRLLMG